MKNIKYILVSLMLIIASSCNGFLDEVPDNRAEVDTKEKAIKLLVSAYPNVAFCMPAELSSDNTDEYLADPNDGRTFNQLYNWEDVTEEEVEDVPSLVWERNYRAISNANMALDALNDMGNTSDIMAIKAEALMARAYSHFILVNMFCQHYTKTHAATDLGIPYMETSETDLYPQYERGTVAGVYGKIAKDIGDALPYISDEYHTVPKYHFNVQAAHAFAARFYLYYQNWDSAIICATKALGSNPQTLLRDYVALAQVPGEVHKSSEQYIQAPHKCNFLLTAHASCLGLIYGPYDFAAHYSHGAKIANTETWYAKGPWGNSSQSTYVRSPYNYTSGLDKILLPRLPYLFEVKDPVTNTGIWRTIFANFTAEETLLVRAEAYIMKKEYSKALADINLWVGNTLKNNVQITETNITDWVNSFAEYTPKEPTPKKQLNPEFAIEAGLQESYIHCLLHIRRLETIHTGLRWFDVKRYGIEVWRRGIENGNITTVNTNSLKNRDLRCALQIPKDVIAAGLAANPR